MATHKFSPGSVLKKINEIESKFPVNEWEINGLKVWPFLRTALAYSQNQNPNTKKNKTVKPLHKRMLEYARISLMAPFEYLRFKSQIKKSTRLFVGSITHRVSIKEVLINKYFDTSVPLFSSKNESSTVLDTGKLFSKEKYYNKNILFSLWFLYAFMELRKKLKLAHRPKTTIKLPGYDEFYQHLLNDFEHTATIKNNFNKQSVISRITAVYERKELLKMILKGSEVRYAYFLCYYSSLLYPLIGACNELGIKTVDIQHGGQGPGHYSYDNWSAAPAEGYALLPRYFWNWDDNSAAIINRWADETQYHKAVPVGNPWTDVSLRIYDTPPDYRDYILINMNEIVAEDFIVTAIQHFKHERKWVLRMHPRTYHNKKALEDQIREKGICEYVRIEDSNKIPLPVSLLYCTHFFSKPSGSIIEAVELGLKPVLFRSHIEYYNHYVTNGRVDQLSEDTAEGLIRYLNETSDLKLGAQINVKSDSEDKFYKFERLTS
jgi:hypothetical protein